MEYTSSPIESRGAKTLAAYESLLEHEPKIIASFVPKNGAAEKAAFLKGEIDTPNHEYDKLDAYNLEEAALAIEQAGAALLDSLDDTNKHRTLYEDVIADYLQKLRMLKSARELKHASSEEDKRQAAEQYMADNIELYGAPDEATYRSLLQEEVAAIDEKTVGERAEGIRAELHTLLPETAQFEKVERFKPSEETVEWMHIAAEGLYSGMLAHIPEQKVFMLDEVQDIFSEIITDEFGEAASDWQVTIEQAQSIVVKTAEKKIVIPIDRGEVSYKQLRKLVVHEIGVHVLRSVMGEGTNLEPLRTGLNNYLDAEEALAKVMEQAIDGEFAEAGVDTISRPV